MKKIIIFLICLLTSSANALPTIYVNGNHPLPYSDGYNYGYHRGKEDVYNNVARAVFITGVVIVAGVIIYNLGKESNWTTNEKGVVYRF